MSSDPLSIASPALGMFQSADPAIFIPAAQQGGENFIHSCTNLCISERNLATRPRWRELALAGSPPADWLTANTQGAISYDPTVGVSVNKANSPQSIVESAAGKLYRIVPGNRNFTVEDISAGYTAPAADRLAFLVQATNYVIRTSRLATTQIWDGTTTITSSGYYPEQPTYSQLPNFAGPLAFTNRVWVANKGTEILAGDQVHATDLYTNSDVIRTSQQATDILSTSFSSPFSLGEAIGMFVVASYQGGAIPAQSDVYIATQGGGLWAILGGQPRETWGQTPMVRGISDDTGPAGPYAAWAGMSELLFRSNRGISSIKTLVQGNNAIANPHIEIGQEILPLLQLDSPDLLLYASCAKVNDQQRMLFTVNPKVKGPHRWHGGYVSAALAPSRSRQPEPLAWEAVCTLPEAMGEIIQLVRMRSISGTRIYALLRKTDGTKGLAEYTSDWGDDVLADGTAVPIPWQLLTRKLGCKGEYTPCTFRDAWLILRDIRDKVEVRILARGSSDSPFKEYWTGTVCNENWNLDCGSEFRGLAESGPICLGTPFDDLNTPWIEILIQGTGCCTVDLAFGEPGSESARTSPGNRDQTTLGAVLCQFDIFRRA